MAYATGSCTGHLELLDALKNFLTSNGWACLADRQEDLADTSSTKPSSLSHRSVYFKGTGLAGEDEVYIGLQDWQYSGSDIYNLALQGYTGFRESADFWNQPGAQPLNSSKYNLALTLHNTEMKYWFVANGRRVIIVVRVGSVYVCAYLGLMLPYCLPSQWPYPLFVGGNARSLNTRYSSTSADYNANFWAPTSAYDTSYLYRTHGSLWASEWRPVGVGPFPIDASSANPCVMYAHNHFKIVNYVNDDYYNDRSISMDTLLDTNISGQKIVRPMQLFGRDGMLGELDGMGKIVGTSLVSEDVISADGCDWLCVQDTFNESTVRYAAVALR